MIIAFFCDVCYFDGILSLYVSPCALSVNEYWQSFMNFNSLFGFLPSVLIYFLLVHIKVIYWYLTN